MPQAFLIIKPSSLGDVVTTLPMVCDLKAACPAAQIDWVIHPGLADLLRGHWAINNLIAFDRKGMAAWWYKPAANKLFRNLISAVRRPAYHCVIDAQGLLRSGLLAHISRAPTRIGFANAREGSRWCYTHHATLPPLPQMAVARMRALLATLEIDTSGPPRYDIPIAPAARAAMEAQLPSAPAMLIPGARWDTKRWGIEGYTAIATRLHQAGLPVVLLGSPDEKPLCDQIQQAVPSAVNLAGRTTLAQMIAALDRARVVIANDSGPLHVAVALGKPVVALYGPTDPNFVGPYGQLNHVIRFPVTCHPCRLRTCDHHSCMKGITVEQVWEKTRDVAGIEG